MFSSALLSSENIESQYTDYQKRIRLTFVDDFFDEKWT